MRFADKRPDFHRHSKELEDAVAPFEGLTGHLSVDECLASRASLLKLQNDTRNLLFCAEVEGILPTQKRLQTLALSITNNLLEIERRLQDRAGRPRPAPGFTEIVERALNQSATRSGLTLVDTSSGRKPIQYAGFDDVFQNASVYSVWMTQDRRIATGFASYPHVLASWSERCGSNTELAAVIVSKATEDRVLFVKPRLVHA